MWAGFRDQPGLDELKDLPTHISLVMGIAGFPLGPEAIRAVDSPQRCRGPVWDKAERSTSGNLSQMPPSS